MHKYLQKETVDLGQAVAFKNAVTDSLEEKRNDATAADLHGKAMALFEVNRLLVPEPSIQRRKTKVMQDFIVESSCGAGSEVSYSSKLENLKQTRFFPCIDRMLSEIKNRFSEYDEELLCGIMACCPSSEKFLSEPHLAALTLHYGIELKSEEVVIAKKLPKTQERGWWDS